MFQSYLKTAWRNLLRNKLHTSINLGGMIIGFTIGIAILLVVYGQLSFDRFHANGDTLYQAYQVFNKTTGEEIANEFDFGSGLAYKTEASSIKRLSRLA